MRKHLSCLGMQINVLFTNSCVQLHKFIVSSAVACLQSHCCDVKMAENYDSKKELENWRENGSKDGKPKCSHYPVKSAARSMTTKERSGG